jgi:ABC-type Fe3+-hydroxamate transport system substrate-binding protein
MNRGIEPGLAPQRVVSLVPSMTDSMFALGLGRFVIGVTDYCPVPEAQTGIARVGGPKDARVAEIADLRPEIVFANSEENPESLIEGLEKSGLRVWVAFPKTVRQAVSDLRDLAMMYVSETALQSVVWLDRAVDWLEGSRPQKTMRAFCPVWREGPREKPDGWVTPGGDTYADDLLSLCGADNVFAGWKGSRYPTVTPEDVIAADPEIILLPDEPFAFQEEDASWFVRNMIFLQAVRRQKIRRVDGRLLFWHGTRLGEAIRQVPQWFRSPGDDS